MFVALADLDWPGPVMGVKEGRAVEIDAILQRFYYTECLTVDRQRLAASEEAWIYVMIEPAKFRLGVDVASTKGVLVWPNSD